jgi:hypothetical protein
MITGFAEKAAHDVQAVRRLAQYLLEIDSLGNVNFHHNPYGPLLVIAVVGPVEQSLVEDSGATEGVLLEIGLGRTTPYVVSRRFRKQLTPELRILARHKYFVLSRAQYLLLAPHVLRLMQCITDDHVRARRSGNMEDPFIVSASTVRVRRYAKEIAHWSTWERLVRGICFDIDSRDAYLVADLCKITLLSPWLAHEVSGLHGFVTRCLDGYSPNSSYERLMRNKYSSEAVNALKRHSLPDYAILELLKLMRKHQLIEFLMYATGCYFELTPVHRSAQKSLPKLQERILLPNREGKAQFGNSQMSARVICLNGRLNVEVAPSDAAKKLVPSSEELYDPNQMDIDEIMFGLGEVEYDFNSEPLF